VDDHAEFFGKLTGDFRVERFAGAADDTQVAMRGAISRR
jgi:hypothetical protein